MSSAGFEPRPCACCTSTLLSYIPTPGFPTFKKQRNRSMVPLPDYQEQKLEELGGEKEGQVFKESQSLL